MKLDASLGGDRGYFPLIEMEVFKRQKLVLFGFPHADGKLQANAVFTRRDSDLRQATSLPTYWIHSQYRESSSGFPILGLNGTLLGMHHWGEPGADNFGVPIRAILNYKKTLGSLGGGLSGILGGSSSGMLGGLTETPAFESVTGKRELKLSLATRDAKIDLSETAKQMIGIKERHDLQKRLSSLSETQFNQLVVLFNGLMPPSDRCTATVGESGPIADRAPRLFNWFGTPTRPRWNPWLKPWMNWDIDS